MQITVGKSKKVYDTTEMTEVKRVAHGVYGDPAGYEEVLYVAEDGKYFLYGVGGETSVYPEGKSSSASPRRNSLPGKKQTLKQKSCPLRDSFFILRRKAGAAFFIAMWAVCAGTDSTRRRARPP